MIPVRRPRLEAPLTSRVVPPGIACLLQLIHMPHKRHGMGFLFSLSPAPPPLESRPMLP